MESEFFQCYERVMQKNHLKNWAWIVAFLFVGGLKPLFAANPAFLIYNEGIDITKEADHLENSGARIRQRIPPQILVVDLPDSIKPNKISGTKSVYTTAIPLSTLDSLGTVALAAGMQWNRGMIRSTKASGQAMGAMRVLVAQRSLPAPASIALSSPENGLIEAQWEAVDSALYYDVEAAIDSNFNQKIASTRTNLLRVVIPSFEGSGNKTIFVRVRGADSIEAGDGTREDVLGAWSRATSLEIAGSAANASLSSPVLTSPFPNYISEGFTLILEWIAGTTAQSRLQVSRTSIFSETIFDTVVSGGEFVLPSPGLRVGDSLYWRVKSWGASNSAWSDVRSFRIGAPQNSLKDMFVNPEAPQ